MQIEKDQKEKIENFKRVRFFSYFDRFDDVLQFAKYLIVSLTLLTLLLIVLNIYNVVSLQKKTKTLTEYAKATTLFLKQQELLNASVLATRIAADYFRLSYDNFDAISDSLSRLFYYRKRPQLYGQLKELRHIIVKGKIIQYPKKIHYDKVGARRIYVSYGDKKLAALFVSVPATVVISREGIEDQKQIEAVFGVYFVKSPKGLTNPYGLDIFDFGRIK